MGVPLLFICEFCSKILLSIPVNNLYEIRSSGLDFYLMNKGFRGFYRLTLKAHFFSAPCWVQQICTMCIYLCVFRKVMHAKPIFTWAYEGHGNIENIKKLLVPSQVAGRLYNVII
jgi:hypothetical protein